MNLSDLKAQVTLGEDSRRQFKRDVTNVDALAAEMAAFANGEGGVIYLGVDDDGGLPGLSRADVVRINQLISNAAAQHIRSPLMVQTENLEIEHGRLVSYMAKGLLPYRGLGLASRGRWKSGLRSISTMTVTAICSRQRFTEGPSKRWIVSLLVRGNRKVHRKSSKLCAPTPRSRLQTLPFMLESQFEPSRGR